MIYDPALPLLLFVEGHLGEGRGGKEQVSIFIFLHYPRASLPK